MGRPMPLPMLITATTWEDTVDTTDTPIEVIMADTGNVKPRLNPLLPPPNPKLMPPLMLITDTTDTEDTMVDTVDTTDTPIEVIMADTGRDPLKPKLNPKLMPLPMPGTDITDILTDTVTVWDTVDTTDTPMPVMAVITADGGNLFYTMSRLLKWK